MSKIRVLLADDHAVVRDGLKAILDEAGDIDVVGLAADGLEAVRTACELEPDIVVMDIAMPRLDGIGATRRILAAKPKTHILILSQYEAEQYVLDAIEAGASGYLLKRDAGADLAEAIHSLCRWGAVLHPLAARILLDAQPQAEGTKRCDKYDCLTGREREVLILVAEGYTSQQIADLLHVSPKTVDSHRTSLMSKLDLHDRTEVVKYALRQQLIEL